MANLKPWYNMFPHSNYSQFNLDWLISKYGEYDQRIKTVEDAVADHDERLQAAETDIVDLKGRMDTAEGDIDTLEGRMDTAEGDIDALEGRMDTAEGDIDALEGRMDTAEDDIDALELVVGNANSGLVKAVSDLQSDVSDINQDIIDIGIKDQAQDNDIEGLDSRVETLETNAVVANPGGTGSNLNSIRISGVTYLIPSGGGGGGGSSVTPNPAGAATDTLTKVDIDGTIYEIPDSRSDVTALQGAVDDLEAAVLDIDTRIGTVINKNLSALNIGPALSTGDVIELTGSGIVPMDQTITLGPGVYQVSYSCDFDTTNYGSTPRFLGCYIRNASTHTNLSRGKYSVFGTERAMITQAASVSCMTIVTVAEGNTLSLVPGIRCNSSKTNTGFAITDSEFAAVRLGVVG